jgi:Gpi18-like mannosyltransferase
MTETNHERLHDSDQGKDLKDPSNGDVDTNSQLQMEQTQTGSDELDLVETADLVTAELIENQDELGVSPVGDESTSVLLANETLELASLQDAKESSRLLHGYLAAAILVNFCLLFLKGYAADLGYWENWIGQLSANGYNNFNGNYPPFYVHWLYVVGKVYSFIGVPLEANNFLKFLTQIPVMLSHCAFTVIIYSLLNRFSAKPSLKHLVMMLTVFNPTILVNGPIWGQVDLLPVTFVVCALLLCFHERFGYMALPMFTLALLTKFQMVAFAPILAFLFFRNIKQNLLGILISGVLGSLVFLPSLIAGQFVQAFKQAYIDTLGQYPMTTFNAANIWILLTSNTAPDSQILFGVSEGSVFAKVATAKYFGILSFVAIAFWIFVQGAYRTFKQRATSDIQEPLSHALFSSMLSAIAFFTLLPAMHERYLFPAAVMSLAYVAVAQKKLIYPIVISVLCSLNMFIILELNGSDIWHGLAWVMVTLLVLGVLETFFGEKLFSRLSCLSLSVYRLPALSVWVFMIAFSVMFLSFYEKYKVEKLALSENQIILTSLPKISATQDYGTLQVNKSYDGNKLSINGRRYEQGIGTHANSLIKYQLPENAQEFSFVAALDDEVGLADVQFSVLGDDRLLWESKIFAGIDRKAEIKTLDVRGIKILTLKVASLKDDKWDHADWVNAVVTLGDNK